MRVSVRVTDKLTVALYDSVSGQAFGEVFSTQEDADEFIDWLDMCNYPDPRTLSVEKLAELRGEWWEGRPE